MLGKIDTDKILGTGLVSALILFVVGNVILVLVGQTPLPMEFGNTIVTGLVAYMGRSLVEKLRNQKDDVSN
ncbi:MAG: hypothetical protein IKN27_06745 [Selenomonadaceae bacterium]|nr:hypothetical protein [Selenomonadaceae bacterium]